MIQSPRNLLLNYCSGSYFLPRQAQSDLGVTSFLPPSSKIQNNEASLFANSSEMNTISIASQETSKVAKDKTLKKRRVKPKSLRPKPKPKAINNDSSYDDLTPPIRVEFFLKTIVLIFPTFKRNIMLFMN